ncbi:hypothetical protein [Shewanella algae]|uniref:hypothetical protein n=1 Tax=Shewanella algae TaxID=38313 RepID=UPI000F425924|nr:hypothetical protein [Shewanella algae]AYV14340.1 hypothetical protein EEY24_16475 [Shewanella algae]
MALKPLNASQKRLLHHLALSMAVANLEAEVLKPAVEKEGKKFSDGEFRRHFFKTMPEVGQAERAFKKAIQQAYEELSVAFKPKSGGDNGK